ncbi:hypothetical protein ACAW74_11235 [Fibrella sp. WM1]|uniref:hypothetical protein n=1 Tax=Fibrella musci TaxID=3242485 RepID=UPI0035203F84
MTFVDGQTIEYQYDAAGVKRRQKDRAGVWTDYVGHQLWRSGTLLQAAHSEGRFHKTGTVAALQAGPGSLHIEARGTYLTSSDSDGNLLNGKLSVGYLIPIGR